MLRVSYCDRVVSVVRLPSSTFCLVYAVEAIFSVQDNIFSPIIMKFNQNVCLDEISEKFENGSCRIKKIGH